MPVVVLTRAQPLRIANCRTCSKTRKGRNGRLCKPLGIPVNPKDCRENMSCKFYHKHKTNGGYGFKQSRTDWDGIR